MLNTEPPPGGFFTSEDREHRIFKAWTAMLEGRMTEHRVRNDSHAIDERDTARLRGRISELKDLLALAMPPQRGSAPAEESPGAWGREAD